MLSLRVDPFLQLLLLIGGFILTSGLMAMVDAAILSVTFGEVEEMVAQRKWGALPLRAVSRRLTRAVVVIVIATNVVNVLGPILVGEWAVFLFGSRVIGVITAVLTCGTIIFSEIIPKGLGTHYAPGISRVAAPVILLLIYVLYPVVLVLEWLVGFFKVGKRVIGTEEQIRALARIGGGLGHIRETEGELIHRVFILNDRRARDLMTPRRRVVALSSRLSLAHAAAQIARHPHSRYPVYEGSVDHVKGIVMSHDLYEAVAAGKETAPLSSILRDVLFVPVSMRGDALLTLFRRRNIHLAIVLDGAKMAGIVSLEDVLEELVGEIEDERDAAKILA